jgi:hypothetical protein
MLITEIYLGANLAHSKAGAASGRSRSPLLKRAFKILGEIMRPLIELDLCWPTESLDNDGVRHPRARHSAPRCERRERTARSSTVLDADQARKLRDSIDTSAVVGLRDRALISVMTFAFARIGAVVAMRVEDYYPKRQALVGSAA